MRRTEVCTVGSGLCDMYDEIKAYTPYNVSLAKTLTELF